MLGVRRGGQDGVVAAGMQAEEDFGAGRFFDSQAGRADGDTTIVAHADGGAQAPDIRPPWTRGHRTQHRTFFFLRGVPRLLRRLPQFAVPFLGVVMLAQRLQVPVGFRPVR